MDDTSPLVLCPSDFSHGPTLEARPAREKLFSGADHALFVFLFYFDQRFVL